MCARIRRFRMVCVRLKEFGNAGMSRPFLVVYTGGIFVNALSPLVLHLILARQHHPTSIARWIRKAVLFDAFCDTIYGTPQREFT